MSIDQVSRESAAKSPRLRLVTTVIAPHTSTALEETARYRLNSVGRGKWTDLRPSGWSDFIDRLWPGEQVHVDHGIVRDREIPSEYSLGISLYQTLACRASESRLALPQALKSAFPQMQFDADELTADAIGVAWPVRARLMPAEVQLMDSSVRKSELISLPVGIAHPGDLPNWVLTAPFDEPLSDALHIQVRFAAVEFDDTKQQAALDLLRRIRCGVIRAFDPRSPMNPSSHDQTLLERTEARLAEWMRRPAPAYAFDVILRSPSSLSNYVLQRIGRDVFGTYPWQLQLTEELADVMVDSQPWPLKSTQGHGGWFPAIDRLASFGIPTSEPEPTRLPQGDGAHVGKVGPTRIVFPDVMRTSHVAVVGGSGTGKSTLLLRLLEQDMAHGHGVGLIDPHGDLVDAVMSLVPRDRAHDLVIADVDDQEFSVSFNPLADTRGNSLLQNFVASQIVDLIERVFETPTTTGPMLRNNLRHALLLAMCHPEGGTMADAARVFEDNDFRDWLLSKADQPVKDYFSAFSKTHGSDTGYESWRPYLMARLHPFTKNPALLRMLNRPSTVSLSKLMDEGRIVLLRLSKATLQDIECQLLGSLLAMQFHIAALSRASLAPDRRRPFHLVVDEFHTFANDSTPALFREARKFGLGLTVATQSFSSLKHRKGADLADAVLANTATKVFFRLSPGDANMVDEYSEPVFGARDLTRTTNYSAVVCMNATDAPPFRMKTELPAQALDPLPTPVLRRLSGQRYGTPIATANEYLARRHGVAVESLRQTSLWIPQHIGQP